LASLRKKQGRAEDSAPVASTPIQAAEPPPVAADVKPPEPINTEAPAEVAARDAIALQLRLREMENAEALQRDAVQQQQRLAAEPPQQQQQPPAMPAAVEKWLIEHPEYTDPNDHVAQAEIHLATVKCMRDGKTWDQPDFIPTIERHLGLRQQQPHPQPNGNDVPKQNINAQPAPRAPDHSRGQASAPARQYAGPPVSAPPTRETPSYTTGRPIGRRAPLNAAEIEIARSSGISPEEYAANKERMERMKASGQLQG